MQNNKQNNIKIFESTDDMNESVANFILRIAEESIKERGRFVFCISGGNTPKSLYNLLSTKPFRKMPFWKNTFIFWGDERCVPFNDENNNAHMAYAILFNKIDIPSTQIFPVPTQLPPIEAAKKYEETIRVFFENAAPCFDLILLGLGEDGHTASLFPGTPLLHEKSRLIKDVFIDEQQMYRITMTAPLINKSRHIIFLVSGENKSAILEAVLNGPYQPEKYPAQLIKPKKGKVYWYVDDKAATRLQDMFIPVFRHCN